MSESVVSKVAESGVILDVVVSSEGSKVCEVEGLMGTTGGPVTLYRKSVLALDFRTAASCPLEFAER